MVYSSETHSLMVLLLMSYNMIKMDIKSAKLNQKRNMILKILSVSKAITVLKLILMIQTIKLMHQNLHTLHIMVQLTTQVIISLEIGGIT